MENWEWSFSLMFYGSMDFEMFIFQTYVTIFESEATKGIIFHL